MTYYVVLYCYAVFMLLCDLVRINSIFHKLYFFLLNIVMRSITRPITQNMGVTNVLLPEKINEAYLGMDTRNILDPPVDMAKIQHNFELYEKLKILESNHIHPINHYRVALLCLEELLYSYDMPSRLTLKPTYGGLFNDWDLEKNEGPSYFF